MGVKYCARNGCNEIMCDRYSLEHGYICQECYEELTVHECNIHDFMRSRKADEYIKNLWKEKLNIIFIGE